MSELSSGDPAFIPFPKLPRLRRGVVVTEKIDGTNAAVIVTPPLPGPERGLEREYGVDVAGGMFVMAQSRKRLIRPGDDNFGFAAWVHEHAAELSGLGVGHHYGEWWGQGIQRGYGLEEKRFSLFNPDYDLSGIPPGLVETVPVLARGTLGQSLNLRYDTPDPIERALRDLRQFGSQAAPGFDDPEGVVVYHTAARQMFKVTLEGDEQPKSRREQVE